MAKLKPFRCQNQNCSEDHAGRLIFDFWAEKPVCPKCGADGKVMPDVVIPLSIIHFDAPTNVYGRGERVAACTGRPHNGQPASGNPEVVNCPECKTKPAYLKLAEERGMELILPAPDSEEDIEAVRQAGANQLAALEAALQG